MTQRNTELVLIEKRAKLFAVDLQIMQLMQKRVDLVRDIWKFKESRGLSRLDPEREELLLKMLQRASRLSDTSVYTLLNAVLSITKNEIDL